jgi:lysophospholipase L1-like esterase
VDISNIALDDDIVELLVKPGAAGPKTKAALTDLTDASIARPDNGDAARGGRDTAYRTWFDQLASSATPRVLIEGNSIVAGSGATGQPTAFAQLVKKAIEKRYAAAVVTIDGHAGWTTTQIKDNAVPGVLTANAHGLVILGPLLANDYSAGINPATTQANIAQIVSDYQSANAGPPPSIVIVAEWERSDVATPAHPYADYVAAARAVAAATDGVTVLDLSTRIGAVDTDELSLFADGVHPNDRGHALTARLVTADILTSDPAPLVYPEHHLITSLHEPIATSGSWSRTGVAGSLLYSNHLIFSAGAQDNSITYSFVGDAGTYALTLAHQRRTDGAQVAVYIDGVLQGAGNTWDTYDAAGPSYASTVVTGFSVPKSGRHTVELRAATKNAFSSGYLLAFSALAITRTGA